MQIKFNDVSFRYDKNRPVLNNISFEIDKNEPVGLIGANGAGKSTLLKLMVGLAEGYDGDIYIDGMEPVKKNLPEIRRKTGYVFQDSDSQLFMPDVYSETAFALRNYGISEDEADRRINEVLDKLGIMHLKDRQIYKLSGGEKKIVSLAVVMAMDAEIMLMDEPTIALDPGNRRKLINILNKYDGLKIIASHDLDMIMETCRRTILISEGRIAADGKTEKTLTDKKLLEQAGLELPICMQNLKFL